MVKVNSPSPAVSIIVIELAFFDNYPVTAITSDDAAIDCKRIITDCFREFKMTMKETGSCITSTIRRK